jgi:hypothetical protein
VDQQAGFAAGTYCGAWSASTRYLVLGGDDPCWRSVLEAPRPISKSLGTCSSECE